MFKAVSKKPPRSPRSSLFVGMIAIWSQVLGNL